MLEIAGVAKLVDAKDLKSFGSKELCRFDPGRPHHVGQHLFNRSWRNGDFERMI
jgi:hypothetical protein